MTKKYPAFQARSIEAISRALGDTEEGLTNSEIDSVAMACGFAPEEAGTKWKRVYNLLAKDQNSRQDRRGILEFIRNALKPSIYVRTPERFETLRRNLNRALLFEGLEVHEDGKIRRAEAAQTISDALKRAIDLKEELSSRQVHPDVLAYCREELLADNYFHAVLEATKSLAQKMRDRTGCREDGSALVDRVLLGKRPLLAINSLADESQWSEQKGFATLCKGLFGMFRNPTAHAPKVTWPIERDDAIDIMSVLSLAHRRLDKARFGP